jgi:hypothetical protein
MLPVKEKYHYTYYSYEEFGRGYIGKRSCHCNPEEDVKYFGSYTDKTFKPTQKIILETYDTATEAIADEVKLHDFYDVANNPHFANRAKQTSIKFSYVMTSEDASKNSKKSNLKCKELGLGIYSITKEERLEYSRMGGIKQGKINGILNKELNRGFFGMSPEDLKESKIKGAKKVGKDNKELRRGIFGLSKEEAIKNSKKGGNKNKELGLGIFGMTKDQLIQNGKKTSSQKWQCTETGFISNASNLVRYQRARGIDKSNRVRLDQ